jgi:hypothetical protein
VIDPFRVLVEEAFDRSLGLVGSDELQIHSEGRNCGRLDHELKDEFGLGAGSVLRAA